MIESSSSVARSQGVESALTAKGQNKTFRDNGNIPQQMQFVKTQWNYHKIANFLKIEV